jgi:hypothetical protein
MTVLNLRHGSLAPGGDRPWTSDHDLNSMGVVSNAPADAVSFSDLSRNPRTVIDRARRLGRVRITHRDSQDFYLTAVDREERRDENLATSARIFEALLRQDAGTLVVLRALPDVFPWVRHLRASELEEFARELFAALTDAAELDVDTNVNEVVAGWRATARIKADKSQYAQALRETDGDLGPVEVHG